MDLSLIIYYAFSDKYQALISGWNTKYLKTNLYYLPTRIKPRPRLGSWGNVELGMWDPDAPRTFINGRDKQGTDKKKFKLKQLNNIFKR